MVEAQGVAPWSDRCQRSVLLLNDAPVLVESEGVAPSFPRCERGVLLLDDDPTVYPISFISHLTVGRNLRLSFGRRPVVFPEFPCRASVQREHRTLRRAFFRL